MNQTTIAISELLLSNHKSKNNIVSIILEYAILKQKLDVVNNQSWYFKNGIESNKKKLKSLETSYINFQNYYNSHTQDDLILIRSKKKEIKDHWEQNPELNMIARIYLNSVIRNINKLNDLILIKKRIPQLYSLNEHMQNTAQLELLMNM